MADVSYLLVNIPATTQRGRVQGGAEIVEVPRVTWGVDTTTGRQRALLLQIT